MSVSVYQGLMSLVIVTVGLGCPAVSGQQRTTATYDDWTVACAGTQICEVMSTQQAQGQLTVASQITLSGMARDNSLKLSVQIPPNVWLPTGIKLIADNKDTGIAAAFRWCIPG